MKKKPIKKSGHLYTDPEWGIPQNQSVSIDGISYSFNYVWNETLKSIILTIIMGGNIIFKSKLVIGTPMTAYFNKLDFELFKKVEVVTITPVEASDKGCILFLEWVVNQ